MYRSRSGGNVELLINGIILEGELQMPRNAIGIVVFALGSGSSRHSPRNQYVALALQKAGIGTLVVDLLTEDEEEVYEKRFDIDLLTYRLIKIVEWIWSNPKTENLPIGLFGASTGAAAVLRAAGSLGNEIKAVVSRGGRTDLVMKELHRVTAPTLLIVGGYDREDLEMNRLALNALCCCRELEIVPKATHLFEEEGALENVTSLATNWYHKQFSTAEKPALAGVV